MYVTVYVIINTYIQRTYSNRLNVTICEETMYVHIHGYTQRRGTMYVNIPTYKQSSVNQN